MVKTPTAPVSQVPSAPFSIEQLETDICTILLMEARRHNHLMDSSLGLKALGVNDLPLNGFWDLGAEASDLGLTFDLVRESHFAEAMLDHYDFGFHAITGARSEPMEYETLHTWFAAYLIDLSQSAYVDEIDSYAGCDLPEAIRRCLHMIELSNARCILEGHKPFSFFSRIIGKKDDDAAWEGELTIRQLAMLAGIEEMSLRSLISRKSPPILAIQKQDRRTFIDAAVAKEWLKAKGRYQPVKIGRRTVDLDLVVTQFRDLGDLHSSMRDRLGVLCDRDAAAMQKFTALMQRHDKSDLQNMTKDDYGNAPLMADLAQALELPADWMVYRAQEVLLKDEIARRQSQLDQLKQQQPASKPNQQQGAPS